MKAGAESRKEWKNKWVAKRNIGSVKGTGTGYDVFYAKQMYKILNYRN